MVVGSLTVECDVVVIGSGPGGYVAAIRAAQLGKDVIVVEKEKKVGGVCLNKGCIPTKAVITSSNYYNVLTQLEHMGISAKDVNVDIDKMREWKDGIVSKLESGIRGLFEKYGIELIQGNATFKSKHEISVFGQSDVNTIKFKSAIIATGSLPLQIPNVEFDNKKIITSDEVFKLEDIPKKMCIIGGGYIGTEMGTVYGKLGSEVHILEGGSRLISQLDSEIVEVMAKEICKFNVNPHYNSLAKSAKINGDKVIVEFTENGDDQTIECDKLLVVVGRKPNTSELNLSSIGIETDPKGFINVDTQLKTNLEHIYAIGDVVAGPMLAHKATKEGKIAGENAGGENSYLNNKVIPTVVYNDPEIASVGLTKQQAESKGYEVLSDKFPYAASGRAQMFEKTTGFVKIIADKKTNLILGVHMVGPHISENIAEATLAIEMGATLEDIASIIHPHPTVSEGIGEVSELALNKSVNIYREPKSNK
jgi:dihydrolipoamide dehydrogenase